MFRSQSIAYYQLVMPRESAWSIMDKLGNLGAIELIDHDPEQPLINRPFANYVKRCDELLQKLNQLHKEAQTLDLLRNLKKGTIQDFLKQPTLHSHTYLDQLEETITKRMNTFSDHQKSYEQLMEQSKYMSQYIMILKETRKYLGETLFRMKQDETSKFDYFVGIVSSKEKYQFERVVFRITKGNAILQLIAIDDNRQIFVILFPDSGSSSFIKSKLQKLSETMSQGNYPIPSNSKDFDRKLVDLEKQYEEITHLLALTHTQLCSSVAEFLAPQNGMSLIEQYRLYLIKEKELYIQLNKLKMQGHLFIGELWIPKVSIPDLEQAIQMVKLGNPHTPSGQLAMKVPPKNLTIPTFFKLNAFTAPFQQIVNTYGIPRYQEINPALLSIVTFPFLFGVMFGDIGHGFLLLMFGISQCYIGQEPFKEIRYLILMMGLFSFYAGFIYNDYLSMSLDIFGSCYMQDGQVTQIKQSDCNYPFGTDPAWGQNLEFGDSVKMKFSVIMAFFHMGLGLCMLGGNLIHRKDYFSVFNKFLPQMVFLVCTIGYMDFLIFYKWLTPFTPNTAPSIINTMIAMALQFGKVDGLPMYDQNTQEAVQLILISIAFLCIPWMWLPNILKAYYQSKLYHAQTIDYGKLVEESHIDIQMQEFTYREGLDDTLQSPPGEPNLLDTSLPTIQNENEHEFSEVLVHETIEMIEYVLGVISNTASYLRLWALSLAHSQLAEVFYQLALSEDVQNGNPVLLILHYPIFALATFGVLMCMDSLECFLHSLRLHWVEFQNKFYKGDGIEFKVFSFQAKMEDYNGGQGQ